MACYKPLKGYKDPHSGGIVFYKTSTKMEVACGQCLGCRSDRALMWAMRIVHESTLYEDQHGNCFVTLTYRDRSECNAEQLKKGHYVPGDFSLNKTHFQKFIRRLRKHFKNQKIRYFHCGEYGDESQRPHYHACMFNVSFDDMQLYQSNEGIHTFSSPTLEELWPYGFATVGELNFETAAYTARYILKKITGRQANDHYLRSDSYGVAFWLEPEYITMSLGRKFPGGIGAGWYEKYKTDVFPADETPVPGKGVIRKVPRYYETILESENPDQLALVKSLRQIFIKEHAADFTPERLQDKYKCHKARSKTMTRGN